MWSVCLCASACPVCPVCVPAPPGVFLPVWVLVGPFPTEAPTETKVALALTRTHTKGSNA